MSGLLLINTAELLLDAAIAPNTKSTYSTAMQQMLIFLDKYFPKAELVDFTVEKIVLFIAYLFEEGKSPYTISTYLAALSYYLKFKGKPDITNNFIIKKLVNGDKRLALFPQFSRMQNMLIET
jgi:site-specific recombinase XerD